MSMCKMCFCFPQDSTSFDVASPPHSPGYPGSRQLHQGQAHYPDSKPFSYAAAINSPQTAQKQGVHEDSMKVTVHRDHSPRSQRGNVVSEGHANLQGYVHADDYAAQNTATIYQRIDRNRTVSSPDTSLSSGQDCYESDTFHSYDSFGQSEGIYGQFVQPSNGSHHRPSLTYVPPPVVPMLPDFGKPAIRDQQLHLHEQQPPKVVNKNASPSMPIDAASPHNHHAYHHHHKPHHHTHQQHEQSQVVTRHHSHHSPSSSSSPVVSPKRTNSARMKSKQDKLPHPPTTPVPPPPPPPPAPTHDKHVSAVTNTRTPSPPLPPPPPEPGFPSKTRSSKKRTEPCPPSPLASHSKTAETPPHQLCMSGPALPHHHHHHHPHQHPSLVDFKNTDLPQHNHHQVKAPTAQAAPPPPPPPPARTSSTPQLLTNHLPDLNSTPAGIRSPRSGSPARHHVHRQTSLATMDDLAQIKLRTVGGKYWV